MRILRSPSSSPRGTQPSSSLPSAQLRIRQGRQLRCGHDKPRGSASIHLAAIKISSHHSTLPRRGRCHGTPPLSETRFWICRGRGGAGRRRGGRAPRAATAPRRRPAAARKRRCAPGGHDRRRGGSPGARTGAMGPRSWPGMGQGQGMGQASPRLGVAPPASLGLASPPLAPPSPLLAPPLLVRCDQSNAGRAGFRPPVSAPTTSSDVGQAHQQKTPRERGFCRDA